MQWPLVDFIGEVVAYCQSKLSRSINVEYGMKKHVQGKQR
mgnify:CR=1 FL=1